MKSSRSKAVQKFRKSLEIGSRLQSIRELFNLSQQQFADELIMTREALANFESGRTPLKAQRALEICEQYVISERWLATGVGLMRQTMDLNNDSAAKKIPAGVTFWTAYETILGARYQDLWRQDPHTIRFSACGESTRTRSNLLDCYLQIWNAWVQPGLGATDDLIHGLIEWGNAYCEKNAHINLPEADIVYGILGDLGLPIGSERFLDEHRKYSKGK